MKIPNYKILKKLGEGGMGTVYLAEHELIKRKVAIKVLHKHLVSNEDFITRFRREAELLATLDHQNIVRLNEYFEHDGSLFLIMEYVDGQELDQYINNVSGPIIEGKLVPMFNQILSAMGYAHKKGLIHRDIKPANILISKDGTVKILDFGIAKLVTDDIGLTKSGVQVGTVTYMSPEQVNAEEVDKLTDIYSLGVTLYQMAVGQSPYKNTTSFKTQIKIVQDPFPKAQDIYPGVSDKIENIINKATQKKKVDRYQSCEEFIQSLNADVVRSVINNRNEETIIEKKKVKKINEERTTEKNTQYKNTAKKKKTNVFKIMSIMILVLLSFGITYFIMYSDKHNTEPTTSTIPVVDTTNIGENVEGEDVDLEEIINDLREEGDEEAVTENEEEINKEGRKKEVKNNKSKNNEKEKNIKQKEKVKVVSISDLKYESSKYFNSTTKYSSDWHITSAGRFIIKKFLDSKNMISSSIKKVLIVDNKYLVLLSGYKKPYCDIFTFDGIRVFSKELKGWPVSWSYCKKNMILCSDQWDDLTSRKNYINLKEITLNTGFRKFKYFYGSCNLETVNRYKWNSQ